MKGMHDVHLQFGVGPAFTNRPQAPSVNRRRTSRGGPPRPFVSAGRGPQLAEGALLDLTDSLAAEPDPLPDIPQ